jgi:hypothetical protein
MRKIMSWIVPFVLMSVAGLMIALPGLRKGGAPLEQRAAAPREAGFARSASEEVRRRARQHAENQLHWADQECQRRLAECFDPIETFFHDAEQGIPGFVDEALGWRSKWNFVLDRMPFTTKGHHEAFMREAFGRHLFTPEQLTAALEQCINSLRADVEGIENQMLVRMRADLDKLPLSPIQVTSDEQDLRQAYATVLARVQQSAQPIVQADLTADLGSLVLTDVLLVVGRRLATSGGLLTAASAGSWASFGATLIAGVLVDQFLCWIWDRIADPRGQLANLLRLRFADIRRVLIEGDGATPGLRQRCGDWSQRRRIARRAAVFELLDLKGEGQ